MATKPETTYVILYGSYASALADEVNEFLADNDDDWVLLGSPFVAPEDTHSATQYCQALCKKSKK